MPRSWWQRYFGGDDYLLLEGEPEPDVVERVADFICDALQVGPGSRVLDVGCGVGWHGVALARRGCLVTGVDSSDYMIGRCRALAADEPGFTARRLDFRVMSFDREFDAVLCLGNTLGYAAREDDAEAVGRMAASSVPGGWILIDLHNLPWYKRNAVGRTWWEEDAAFVLSDVTYDEADQRLVTRDVIVPKDGSPRREYGMSLLEYEPSQIAALMASAGVSDVEFYGDACASDDGPLFSREGFTEQSHVMIVAGTKTS